MTAIAAVNLVPLATAGTVFSGTTVTPVVYSPVGFIQPGVAKWADRAGGIPLLYPSFTVSVKLPSNGSKVCRIVAKLSLPTPDVTAPSTSTGIQPAPSKAYECLAQLEMVLPERSTTAERNALRGLLLSALSEWVQASDGDPNSLTGSPLPAAIANFEIPY